MDSNRESSQKHWWDVPCLNFMGWTLVLWMPCGWRQFSTLILLRQQNLWRSLAALTLLCRRIELCLTQWFELELGDGPRSLDLLQDDRGGNAVCDGNSKWIQWAQASCVHFPFYLAIGCLSSLLGGGIVTAIWELFVPCKSRLIEEWI